MEYVCCILLPQICDIPLTPLKQKKLYGHTDRPKNDDGHNSNQVQGT